MRGIQELPNYTDLLRKIQEYEEYHQQIQKLHDDANEAIQLKDAKVAELSDEVRQLEHENAKKDQEVTWSSMA